MDGGVMSDQAVRAVLEPGERIRWHGQPGAGRLFLSVVPALIRDVVFLTVLGFGFYAGWGARLTPYYLIAIATYVFLVWLLFRNVREGTAAGVSHYLVTDRRIILLTPRASPKLFVLLPRLPKDWAERRRTAWLDGRPVVGRIAGGRATIRLRYEAWMSKSINNYPEKAYRSRTIRMYGVTQPDRAIAAIAQLRRDHRSFAPDPEDTVPDDNRAD